LVVIVAHPMVCESFFWHFKGLVVEKCFVIKFELPLPFVMNNTCIYLRVEGPNIYMYRRGRIYKEPLRKIQ
jgi:hypothetical protein